MQIIILHSKLLIQRIKPSILISNDIKNKIKYKPKKQTIRKNTKKFSKLSSGNSSRSALFCPAEFCRANSCLCIQKIPIITIASYFFLIIFIFNIQHIRNYDYNILFSMGSLPDIVDAKFTPRYHIQIL